MAFVNKDYSSVISRLKKVQALVLQKLAGPENSEKEEKLEQVSRKRTRVETTKSTSINPALRLQWQEFGSMLANFEESKTNCQISLLSPSLKVLL